MAKDKTHASVVAGTQLVGEGTRNPPRLGLVDALFGELAKNAVRYCHWKSNVDLEASLVGRNDLDLLVHRGDAQIFEKSVAELGFKRIVDPGKLHYPSVAQFFGLDADTQMLVHIDVYYRVITGTTLLKEYRLPLEDMLLERGREVGNLPLPAAAAELVVTVCREMVKRGSFFEQTVNARKLRRSSISEEVAALLEQSAASHAAVLVERWLPTVSPALWAVCVTALRRDPVSLRTFWLGFKVRRRLAIYRRIGPVRGGLLKANLLGKMLYARSRGKQKTKQWASGGAVVAFVGPEATGKSTLVNEVVGWLGSTFQVKAAHLGKPPPTWISAVPNLALPYLRKRMPRHKTSLKGADSSNDGPPKIGLLYALRLLMLAWDRRALALKLHRLAANGTLVFCDRYPTGQVGAMDSATLPAKEDLRKGLIAWMAALEQRLYSQVPPPDLVIELSVPVEVAISRNRERVKVGKESDDYVYKRHTAGVVPSFPHSSTLQINTDQPQSQLIAALKTKIWQAL